MLWSAALWSGCAPSPQVPLVYPDFSPAAQVRMDVVLTRQVTDPDNFVLRPDEFGGVFVDHQRELIDVGTRDGRLLALDHETGEVRWEQELGGAVSGLPTLATLGDVPQLFVGTDNGVLFALDPDDGGELWRYETEGRVRGAPVVVGDVVYFVNSRDQVFALDGRVGQWRWQYPPDVRGLAGEFTVYGHAGLTHVPSANPLSGDPGTLLTCFDDGHVAALSARSGEPQWLGTVAPPTGGNFSDCDTTPVVDRARGRVYVAGQSTGIYALDQGDGAEQWSFGLRGVGSLAPAPGDGIVAVSSLEGVFAFDGSGRKLWRTQLDPGSISAPVILGNNVIIGHSELGLMVLDVTTGELLGRLLTGSGMSSTLQGDPTTARVYGISNRGLLIAAVLRDLRE